MANWRFPERPRRVPGPAWGLVLVAAACLTASSVLAQGDRASRGRVLLPSAPEAVLAALGGESASWRVEGVRAEADTVVVRLCPGGSESVCRDVALRHRADPCDGRVTGSWCVIEPAGLARDPALAGLDDALADVDAGRVWGVAGPSRPLDFQQATPGSGPGSWLLDQPPPPDPWRVAGRVSQGRGEGADLALRWGPRDDAPWFGVGWTAWPGVGCLLRTRSFCLWQAPEIGGRHPPVPASDLQLLGAWLQERDDPCRFPANRGVAGVRLVLVSLALLLFGILAASVVRAARSGALSPALLAHLGLLTLVAGWTRWALSPWNFVQEFFRSADHLAALQCGQPLLYGEAGPALAGMVDRLTGAGADALFGTHWLLATLTVPAMAWLGRELSGRWLVGLLAAWVVGLLPQHLRFSSSEVLFVPALHFMVVGMAGLAAHLRSRSIPSWCVGTLALVLAVQVRAEVVVVLPMLAGMSLLRPQRPGAWRTPGLWIALGLALGALILMRLLNPTAHQVDPGDPLWSRFLRWVWFEGRVTPGWLLLPWGLGVATIAHRWNRMPALWALASAAVFTGFSLFFFSNDVYRERSQLLAVPFHTILVALGIAAVASVAGMQARLRGGLVLVTAALLGALAIGHRGYVTQVTAAMDEWTFLDKTVPLLPDAPGTRLFAATAGKGAFPFERLWRAGKRPDASDARMLLEEPGEPPTGSRIYYEGLNCRLVDHGPDPDGAALTSTCARIRQRWHLEPLFTREIRADGGPDQEFLPGREGPFPVGFYRVGAARDPGATP